MDLYHTHTPRQRGAKHSRARWRRSHLLPVRGVRIVVEVLLPAHVLEMHHRRRRGAVEDLVLRRRVAACVEAHRRGLLRELAALPTDAAPPGDHADDDEHEGEAADEDLGPPTEDFLFISRRCEKDAVSKRGTRDDERPKGMRSGEAGGELVACSLFLLLSWRQRGLLALI